MKKDMEQAVEKLKGGQYTCVLCKGDRIYTSTERGVKPLLGWLDGGVELKGFSAADKVVGKAAAFLYVLLGVEEVYACVMSEPAMEALKEGGIRFQCELAVPAVINRSGTGRCPMEEAVSQISSPKEALSAVRKRLEELSRRA